MSDLEAKCAAPTLVPTWPCQAGRRWVGCSPIADDAFACVTPVDAAEFDELVAARPHHVLWFAVPEGDPVLKSVGNPQQQGDIPLI